MSVKQPGRQGDILIETIDPKEVNLANYRKVPRKNGRLILAEGEATGHNHLLDGTDEQVELFETFNGEVDGRVIVVHRPVTLIHDEHGAITLDVGTHRTIRQREYEPPTPTPAPIARERWVYD